MLKPLGGSNPLVSAKKLPKLYSRGMLKAVKASLACVMPKERRKGYLLTGLRAFLSLLELAGILAIGFIIASTAIFFTSGSDPDRVLVVAGFDIPAVNAQTLPWVSAAALLVFLLKALFAMLLTRTAALFVAGVEARASKQIAEISLSADLSTDRERSREEILFAVQVGSPLAFSTLLNQVGTIIAEGALIASDQAHCSSQVGNNLFFIT